MEGILTLPLWIGGAIIWMIFQALQPIGGALFGAAVDMMPLAIGVFLVIAALVVATATLVLTVFAQWVARRIDGLRTP